MGRFISGSGGADTGFTRAEVFTSAGTSSWTVPAGVSKAKVFVIGAGSNYRTTEFCFSSSSCCSGVVSPGTNYCLNFIGHLPGAGGGYAEKTLTGVAPGTTMTVNVGSQGGLSASSISLSGTTVTANNATETAVSWNCLSNSTARDNSNDNKTVLGFDLPVCGYRNCINGYFNAGGTASGGDINRTGGEGEFAPYFREDAEIDGAVTITSPGGAGGGVGLAGCTCTQEQRSGYDYSFGGTRYNCVCTIAYLVPQASLNGGYCGCCFSTSAGTAWGCNCLVTYHNVFGGQCYYNLNWANCLCARLLNGGAYLCSSTPGSGGGSAATKLAKSDGSSTNLGGGFPRGNDQYSVNACPVTVGSDSGNSGADGQNGTAEGPLMNPITSTSAGGAGGSSDNVVCYIGFSQDHFSFIFGSNMSNWPCARMENLYASGGSSSSWWMIGYAKDTSSNKKTTHSLPLATLKSRTGENVNNLNFGAGATMNEAAGPGGGGNRLFPTGGTGAVVVVY